VNSLLTRAMGKGDAAAGLLSKSLAGYVSRFPYFPAKWRTGILGRALTWYESRFPYFPGKWLTIRWLCHVHYKQKQIDLYSKFIKKGDLCFDVGANLGNRTQVFLDLGATVVAIEPQDSCVQTLRRKYRNQKRVILVQKGLDERPGEREMLICDYHALSSMSRDWIAACKASGGWFSSFAWHASTVVPTTTLDRLIEEYGIPRFCKIDVEGFDYQVLKGLSRAIQYLSFEFGASYVGPAIDCINYLSSLGKYGFNYSEGESMQLALPSWVRAEEVKEILKSLQDKTIYGDVYAALIG